MFYVQAAMAVVGLLLVICGGMRIGRKEMRRPIAMTVGMILILPLPFCLILSMVVGLSDTWTDAFNAMPRADGQGGFRMGTGKEDSRSEEEIQRAGRRWALDMVTTILSLAGAVIVLGVGVQNWDEQLQAMSLALADGDPTVSQLRTPAMENLPLIPKIPSEVRRYKAAPNSVPLEVEDLGKAKQLHPPYRRLALLRNNAQAFALLGVALLCGASALFVLVPTTPLTVTGSLAGALLGGLFLMTPLLGPRKVAPTYIVFRDALLTVHENEFTVIPWQVIADFQVGQGLNTVDGQHIELSDGIEEQAKLELRVMEQIVARQLPKLVEAVQAGETVALGPFAVNAAGIAQREKSLAWSDVGHLRIQVSTGQRLLSIQQRGSTEPWCLGALNFPNDFLFLELLRRICPPELVTPGMRR